MVSRLTVWTIQANETIIIDTETRSECWMLKDGKPHALMLSAPLEYRQELEKAVEDIRNLDNNI